MQIHDDKRKRLRNPPQDLFGTPTWPPFHFSGTTIGSLGNDDGDVNENVKTVIGLDKQNNNFARASNFFVHFFCAVTARLQRESA